MTDDVAMLTREFIVRRPKTSELPRIHEIYLQSWHQIYENWNLPWTDAKILGEFHIDRLPLSCWFVVEHETRVVGFLRHSPCLRRLDAIYVDTTYLRTGAGCALMQAYLQRARKSVATISLETFRENERALRFFSYFDFEETPIAYTVATSRRELLMLVKNFS